MRVKPLKIWALLLAASLALGGSLPLFAQTLGDKLSKKTQAGDDDRLLVEAKEIVYDNDKNTVSAIGDAQLYYQGKVLEADKVIYDNASKRVIATGHVRMREPTGEVGYGDFMELTSDFKDGFIKSLRIIRQDQSRFAAPQAQRIDGDTTIFDKGTYTACESCKDDPEKPPLWQVRAARIIHKNEERMVYYENATLEFGGLPLLYFPYMSAPDPSVHKKTGFLAPHYIANTTLGTGVSIPFFWNIAPDYDLLLTPTFLSRQGVLMQADWRQRIENGLYTIKLTGINQMDKTAFAPAPYGAGGRDWRGMAETTGLFYLNDKWKAGWDASLVSDRWFLKNYKMKSESLTSFITNSLQTSTSTAYLTGQGERSLFDMRSLYFKTLTSSNDSQKNQPVVLPVIDYDRRFETPLAFGGETRLTMNFTSLSRETADFHSIYRSVGLYGDYTSNGFSTCQPGQFTKGNCILRGTAGSSNRATSELAWRRTFIDEFGQSWTPFGSLRTDVSFLAYDKSNVNAYQSNFINADSQAIARPSGATGITYRFPFVARQWNMTHVLEPIGQIVVRPNEWMANKIPNEDSQSLVFDDTNLFSVNKFSGYDRIEGGTRANVGAKYSITADNGMSGNVLFGQSFHLSGVNSFTQGGAAAVGPLSGLDRAKSDYVGRVQFIPTASYSFTTKARFDELTGATKRLEFTSAMKFGSLSTNLTFGRYAAQPENGYAYKREGALASARYAIDQNYYVFGGTAIDMARKEAEIALLGSSGRTSGLPVVSGIFGGGGYKDECSLFEVSYSESMGGATLGVVQRNRTLMFRIELKTLGGTRFSQSSNTDQ
jgi:LPS-assembly protein